MAQPRPLKPIFPGTDFHPMPRPVVQLQQLESGSFSALPAFKLIMQNNYKRTLVAFGGHAPVELAKRVYDLNIAEDAYDLGMKIYKGRQIHGDIFERQFQKPVFVILPHAVKRFYDGVEYRTCIASGRKGDLAIIPIVVGDVWQDKNKEPNAASVVMVSDLCIRPHAIEGVFQVMMRPKIGDIMQFERSPVPPAPQPKGGSSDEHAHPH